jgi:diguanylate cyclase (GGDEF)-like protein/PAS domain S-box-containing protein
MSSTKRSTLPARDNEKTEQTPSPMLDPAIFRLMADSAPIIILLLDAQGNIQHVNPYFEHLTGYRLDEIKGKNWFSSFIPARDQERIRALFQSAIHDLPIRNNVNPIITASGEECEIEWHGQAIRDARGDITALVSIGQDITKRKQAEEARNLSEQRLQLAVHSAHIGIYDHDHISDTLYWSPEMCDMFGINPDEAVTLDRFMQSLHTEDRDRVAEAINHAHSPASGGSINIEFRIIRADGEVRWLDARSQTIFEGEGNARRKLRTTGVVSDISQRKRDQRALQMMKFSIENMGDKVTWINSEAKVLYANIAACSSLGYTREEMLRMSVPDFDPDFPSEAWPEHWDALKKHGSFTFESRHRTKDGRIYPVEVSINYMRFEDEEYNCGYARDISKRKQMEEELRIAATTFDSQDAILITDRDANILRVNQAFQDMSGYNADELIGMNPSIIKSERHHADFFQIIQAALQNSAKWSGEIWACRKNGEDYPTSVTITAVYDDQQQVSNYVFVARDISEIKKTEQDIHQLAFYDHLTQLPNRRLLLERLQRTIAASARHGWYGALIFLDLDHFKTINDTQGHIIGDRLLIEAARRLLTCVREIDSVARLGGDEFVVVLEELSTQAQEAATQAESIVEKIRDELSKPYDLNNYDYLSTASFGVNLFRGHQESVEDLLKHADIAMYQAKTAGRNVMRFYDPTMQTAIEARADLEDELRQALAKQQFCLHYQIQVDKQRRPLGAEALLRWEHPKRGLVSPAEFILITEETGLIIPIGLWVLQTACTQLKAWHHNALTRDLTLAVNVSAKQFRQNDFVAQVKRILLESGAQASNLKLELTESTVLENVEDTIIKMRELKSLGVSFSMDDFGTGYSSLQYLKRLPLDQIKIDQSFVRDITFDPNDDAIVQTIIAMTEALGLSVIAEGVETETQREFLDRHDCQAYQGYLFGIPLPPEQFEDLLRDLSASSHPLDENNFFSNKS